MRRRAARPSAQLRRLFPEADDATLAWAWKMAMHPPTGTINCLALNGRGEMSGVTTTSGLAWKIPGRVGDSPIIGAGLYVDQDVGAAGSTGRGEENIRVPAPTPSSKTCATACRPREACLDTLKRVARNFNNDRAKLLQFDLSFYALRRDGEYAGASLWKGRKFAVNDGGDEPSRAVRLYGRDGTLNFSGSLALSSACEIVQQLPQSAPARDAIQLSARREQC